MDNFRDSYFQVDWDLTSKRLKGTFWGKQYDTGRGFAVTVINGGQVVTPSNEVLRLKWEKPDNTTGYVNATIVDGKFIVENIDQMFTVHGSVRADFELSVGGEFVTSITFYVNVEKAVAVDAVASSSEFTALQTAITTVDGLDAEMADMTQQLSKTVKKVNGVSPNASGNVTIEVPTIDETNLLRGIVSETEPANPVEGSIWFKPIMPPIPLTDYFFRFDAKELNLNDNSKVATWEDLSGNGNTLTQTTVVSQPTFLKEGFNGRPTLQFNNSIMTKTPFTLDRTDKFTVFFVGKFDNTAGSQTLLQAGILGSAGGRNFGLRSSGTSQIIENYINGSRLSSIPIDVNPFLLAGSWDKLQNKSYKNGLLLSTVICEDSQISTHDVLSVGGRTHESTIESFVGKISEIIYFSRLLSDEELEQMHTYLKLKWGV